MMTFADHNAFIQRVCWMIEMRVPLYRIEATNRKRRHCRIGRIRLK